jgi:hypothetical protein
MGFCTGPIGLLLFKKPAPGVHMAVGLFELARVVRIVGALDEAAGVAEARTGCEATGSFCRTAELCRTCDEAPIPWLLVGFACRAEVGFKSVSIEKRADSFVFALLVLVVAMDGVCSALVLCMFTD